MSSLFKGFLIKGLIRGIKQELHSRNPKVIREENKKATNNNSMLKGDYNGSTSFTKTPDGSK